MFFLEKKKNIYIYVYKYIYTHTHRFIVGNLQSRLKKKPQLPYSEITLGNIVMFILLEKKQSIIGIKLYMMFSNQTGYSF